MNAQSKRTFELTFYNVAEMATEARRCKQLEQEAILVGELTHTQNELDAAVGLIMMRYQPSPQLHTQYTPTDRPIIAPKSLFAENEPRKHKYRTTFDRKDLEPYRLKTYMKCKPKVGRSTISSSINSTRDNNGSRTSLLASCRNILKDFLSQNSGP